MVLRKQHFYCFLYVPAMQGDSTLTNFPVEWQTGKFVRRDSEMTEVFECVFPQNTKSCAWHCRAAERRDRGCCFVWDAALWTRQNFTREAGMVFNPFLEQLSLQTTKLLCIRKVNKELQRRLYPEEPLKRRLTDIEEKEISPEVQRKWCCLLSLGIYLTLD